MPQTTQKSGKGGQGSSIIHTITKGKKSGWEGLVGWFHPTFQIFDETVFASAHSAESSTKCQDQHFSSKKQREQPTLPGF
mmetsp:Transcript_6578/g.10818  ORF Transcript_6578/g.10818 Transcript_6578/m.10818 type:complete len:80 (-) Transcript_6578:2587-2826(-)